MTFFFLFCSLPGHVYLTKLGSPTSQCTMSTKHGHNNCIHRYMLEKCYCYYYRYYYSLPHWRTHSVIVPGWQGRSSLPRRFRRHGRCTENTSKMMCSMRKAGTTYWRYVLAVFGHCSRLFKLQNIWAVVQSFNILMYYYYNNNNLDFFTLWCSLFL